MITVRDLARLLETTAPLAHQESYDNAGLQCGLLTAGITGVLIALDCTPAVVAEAARRGCNVVLCHHPVIFRPLRRLTGQGLVEQTIMAALKADVAIYAAHTNLDNVRQGVNARLAQKLGLVNTRILAPKTGTLGRLITYVPDQADADGQQLSDKVLQALYTAGAGQVGNYRECSFQTPGLGTFTPGPAPAPPSAPKTSPPP
ncbi:Nif3-like dinuclear metal center hexameric protein [Hymenobacter sp. BRD67]|uniref:Nif3-like dinuclear metal center hexameric protein n=1 Tax=Hymenobacter sp. BRD67 TaxID=2675877 RepID=UPI00293BBB90|nr:Nif3-like dinuclear metal center hexameric protein [Hymenobacter sp. BRD67]